MLFLTVGIMKDLIVVLSNSSIMPRVQNMLRNFMSSTTQTMRFIMSKGRATIT